MAFVASLRASGTGGVKDEAFAEQRCERASILNAVCSEGDRLVTKVDPVSPWRKRSDGLVNVSVVATS